MAFFHGEAMNAAGSYTGKKKCMDSPEGRIRYGGRFAAVEPVFGNVRYNKGLEGAFAPCCNRSWRHPPR